MEEFKRQEYTINSNQLFYKLKNTFIKFNDNGQEKISMKYKIRREENLEFAEEPTGTFLVELLNSFHKIEDSIIESKTKIENEKNILEQNVLNLKDNNNYNVEKRKIDTAFNNNCINIILEFRENLIKITPKLSALDNYIYNRLINFDADYNKEFDKLINKFKEKEKYSKQGIDYIIMRLKYLESVNHIKGQLENILDEIELDLKHIKSLIDNAFIHSDETRNNKFAGIESKIPICKIDYETENYKFPHPIQYTYVISDLLDTILKDTGLESIVNISIYQLSLNHKVIIKCKNCKKYFIPKRTDIVYCSKKCREDFTYKLMRENRKSESTYLYYRKLYNRYKNNKIYSNELKKLKNIYIKCKEKQFEDKKVMSILLDFENNVNETHTTKRGRPKKNKKQ